ncbi:MAG: hypothetical protein M0019_07070 [Actinomycetota bacterium]|nr:hypothetical protein [Actinomycetota bacterium]
MALRLKIELTDKIDDSTWRWRRAEAKEPRGSLDASLLYEGAKIGDRVEAIVEKTIDGTTIISVTPPQGAAVKKHETIEIEARKVTTLTTVERAVRGGDRKGSKGDGKRSKPRSEGDSGQNDRSKRRPRRDGEEGASANSEAPKRRERRERPAGAERPAPKPKVAKEKVRLTPARVHRDSLLAELSEHQKPIAEFIFEGGMPRVREEIAKQQDQSGDTLLKLAEEIYPRCEIAIWRDRADAAIAIADGITIRDIKAVVVSGERLVGANEDLKAILEQLKEISTKRRDTLENEWVTEIRELLADKKSIKAVWRSNYAPDNGSKLPDDLLTELAQRASDTLGANASNEIYSQMLNALNLSPIRKMVKPTALPANASEELLTQAREISGRIPALAELLGLKVPPPPRAPRRKIGGEEQSATNVATTPSNTPEAAAPAETVTSPVTDDAETSVAETEVVAPAEEATTTEVETPSEVSSESQEAVEVSVEEEASVESTVSEASPEAAE